MNDPRVLVCRRENYNLRFESVSGMTFSHSTIWRLSPSILKSWRRDWDTLFEMHGGPIYAMQNPTTGKPSDKFLRFSGFEFWKTVSTQDGLRNFFVRRK